MNTIRNSKKNARKSKHTKTDAFTLAIQEMIDFDAKLIIDSFREDRIRSSDFSLDGFKKRQQFVVEYCTNKKALKFSAAKLIKLYQALNKKYRITGLCERIPSIPNIFNSGSLVFISPKYTQQIIDNKLIHRSQAITLDDSKRLYQYLNWTIRVNKINKYINCFSTKNNIKFLLINSELYDQNNNVLYMFCIENDIISEKAQKWQFVKLVTSAELIELVPDCALEQIITQFVDDEVSVDSVCSVDMMNITLLISQFMGNYCDESIVPLGARANGQQFNDLKQENMMTKDDIIFGMHNTSYLQLKGIQTGYDKKRGNKQVLRISLNAFENKILDAAESPDPRHDLIPIVSILSGKKYGDGDYSVDQVLPINIRGDEWIGICYRAGKPVMDLFDGYDITNKAILCNPTFDKDRLSFFNNNIYKIEITPRVQQLPQMQPLPFYNDAPALSSPSTYTPTPDQQIQDFETTPLRLASVSTVSSDNDQDDCMQLELPPDHDSSCGSSMDMHNNQQNEEMKYNYVNFEYNNNNNDVQTDGINTNTNKSPSSMNRTNGSNGEGMMNTNTTRNTNSISIQTTPMCMDGMNNNTNTNNQTTSNMGFHPMNYVQSMNHQINGQYQYNSNNQTQQQLYPQTMQQPMCINNFNNINNYMLPTFPMMPNLQLPNMMPTEGTQTTFHTLNAGNLPPMTPQNTTYIYCYAIPCINTLPNMQTPLIQQALIQQQIMATQQQLMKPKTNMNQQVVSNEPVLLKASTPEFVPLVKQGRSSSIPKPASIEPTISTIKEEI